MICYNSKIIIPFIELCKNQLRVNMVLLGTPMSTGKAIFHFPGRRVLPNDVEVNIIDFMGECARGPYTAVLLNTVSNNVAQTIDSQSSNWNDYPNLPILIALTMWLDWCKWTFESMLKNIQYQWRVYSLSNILENLKSQISPHQWWQFENKRFRCCKTSPVGPYLSCGNALSPLTEFPKRWRNAEGLI